MKFHIQLAILKRHQPILYEFSYTIVFFEVFQRNVYDISYTISHLEAALADSV
ncbi:hypothetical protein [Paenibacillus sp. IITD108]|uniref:hypothetical protein n=1 Tax=Paenibacillus sp. IITD108 TaxID=3116649 RepID=UPI002F3E7208